MIKISTLRRYGIVDIIFALLYLFAFIFILPAYDTLARVLTIFFPVVLLLGGAWLIYEGKFSREIGIGLAALYIVITLFSLFILSYTAGYFKGIYGPLGKGITIVSYLSMVFVVQLFGVWPFFQLRALWPTKKRKKAPRRRVRKDAGKQTPEKSVETPAKKTDTSESE